MNQKTRVYLILLVFLSLITLWYAAENLGSADFIRQYFRHNQPSLPSTPVPVQPVTIVEPSKQPVKITVIALWVTTNDRAPAQYMPLFFQSVEANPTINLLFVNINSNGNGCEPYTAAPNIREVCLTKEEFFQLQADFLCKRWQCSESQLAAVKDLFAKNFSRDRNLSFTRIIRPGIFERYIDPATTIWGWTDIDVVWGNFERVFPWDIAHDFDIIAISSEPNNLESRLLFTRGHMSFFRHSPETLEKLHDFHTFASHDNFIESYPPRPDAEESEYSKYYFSDNTNFTFVTVEGMVSPSRTALTSNEFGTYYGDFEQDEYTPELRSAVISSISLQNTTHIPRFTADGVEQDAVLGTHEDYSGGIWFPTGFATVVNVAFTPETRHTTRASILRRTPGGPVKQRLEPRERFLMHVEGRRLEEGLYKHFQSEKRQEWFQMLPKGGLEHGQILVISYERGAELWDSEGNVISEMHQEPNVKD